MVVVLATHPGPLWHPPLAYPAAAHITPISTPLHLGPLPPAPPTRTPQAGANPLLGLRAPSAKVKRAGVGTGGRLQSVSGVDGVDVGARGEALPDEVEARRDRDPERESERDREGDRYREREKERERYPDRDRDKVRYRERERERVRDKAPERDRDRDRQVEREQDKERDKGKDREGDRDRDLRQDAPPTEGGAVPAKHHNTQPPRQDLQTRVYRGRDRGDGGPRPRGNSTRVDAAVPRRQLPRQGEASRRGKSYR